MLDEKDLQAIQAMMESMEQRTDEKLVSMEQRIIKSTVALIDTEVTPKFDLLAEGQRIIVERLDRMEDRLEDMDVMDTRITALEAMVKKLNREMASLKKAN